MAVAKSKHIKFPGKAPVQEVPPGMEIPEVKAVSHKDLPLGYSPIHDLKPGDRVIIKGPEYADQGIVGDNVLIVERLLENELGAVPPAYSGHNCARFDFTALWTINGKVFEFAHDSRRFKKVVE